MSYRKVYILLVVPRRYDVIQKIVNYNSFYSLVPGIYFVIQIRINSNSFYGLVTRRYYRENPIIRNYRRPASSYVK